MSTAPAAMVAMVVLSASGLLPVLVLVGLRWITIPLAPLAGALVAAFAATGFVAFGGTFLEWFVALAVAGACAIGAGWVLRPDLRPRWPVSGPGQVHLSGGRYRATGAIGMVAVLATCAWCLSDLSSPTVGFDARAVWLQRSGWFLQSHHQLLVNMRVPYMVLIQSAYPSLVSASGAVAWGVTGNHSMRLGVVVISLLNACALATAAFAVVEVGRNLARRLSVREDRAGPDRPLPTAPLAVGVVSAVLLVLISFGITGPFMTNGYADPLWSLAAVGAVAYGLQLQSGRSEQGVAVILVLVAGASKNEGFATAAALIVLIALRGLVAARRDEPQRPWWPPVLVGAGELAAIAVWPVLMEVLGVRGRSTSLTAGAVVSRSRASYDALSPYLHSLVWAVPIAVVGGLVLSGVRRRSGIANDWWAWAGLAGGLVAVVGALATGTGAIGPWLVTTAHRVTEFPALCGWWIVATWAVVASGASPSEDRRRTPGEPPDRGTGTRPPDAVSEGRPDSHERGQTSRALPVGHNGCDVRPA